MMDLILTVFILFNACGKTAYCFTNRSYSYFRNSYRYMGVIILSISIFACSDQADVKDQEKKASLNNTQPEVPNVNKNTLAYLARDCKVTDFSSSKVAFNTSALPQGSNFTAEDVCGYAGIIADNSYEGTKKAGGELCEQADKLANKIGYGSYAEAEKKITTMNDSSNAQALNLLKVCKSKDSRLALIKSVIQSMALSVYSVGHITYGGGTCKAFLALTRSEKGATAYTLIGTEHCSVDTDSDEYIKKYFHPTSRPNSQPLSQFINESFKYTGAMPSMVSNNHGKTYPF